MANFAKGKHYVFARVNCKIEAKEPRNLQFSVVIKLGLSIVSDFIYFLLKY